MGKSATAYSSYGKHINLQYMSQSEYLSLTGSAHRGAMYLTSSGPGSNITSSYIMQLGPTGSDGLTVSAYKFKGDGSLLTGVVADIDGATDGTGITVHATQDKLLISDNGTEKYIQVSQLDNVFLRSDQSDTFNGTLTATGRVMIDDVTEATSKTDGSLQTDGGLSVAKSAVIGKDLDLVENGAIINFGSSSPFVMTHAQANNAALVSANHRLAFGDAGDYIMGNGTDISIVGSNEINLDATTVDINAAVSISGNTSGSTAQFAKLTASAGYFAELFVSGSTLHLGDTSISATEIAPLDGITAGTVAASKVVVVDSDKDITGFRNVTMTGDMTAATVTMTGFTVDADGDTALKSLAVDNSSTIGCDADTDIMTLANQSLALANDVDFNVAKTGGLQLGGTAVTATAAELNLLDGSTANSVVNSKAVVYGSAGEIAASSLAVAGNISGSGKGYFEKDVEIADSLKVSGSGTFVGTLSSSIGDFADIKLGGTAISATAAELNKLDGVTAGTVAASKAVVVDSDKDASGFRNVTATGAVTAGSLVIGSADISEAELETIDGVTAGTVAASKAVVVDSNKDAASFRNLTATGAITAGSFVIGSADISEAELETIDGVTAGTVAASKAVVVDSNKDASGFRHVTATGALTAGTSLIIGSADLNEADMEKLDGITDGTGAANKALVLDASRNVGNINMLTASYAKIGELDVDLINTINKTETTLEILDKLIVVASGSNSANSDGAGLQFGSIEGTDNVASILYDHSNTGLDFNVAGSSEVLLTAGALSPASSDGNALGTTSLMWSDAFLASGAVINFNNGDVTMTHSSNLMTIAGGNTRVDRLEIDGAGNYIDVSDDLYIIAAADVAIDPAGGELKVDGDVVPTYDSTHSLGASGKAWANLYVDAIDLNGQGSISMGGTGRLDLDADDDTSIRASADDVITLEAGGADRVHFGAAAIYPETTDQISLGTASKNFSDLFLDSGAVVNFDGGDVTMTHSSNNLSVEGGHFQVERLRIDGSTNYLDVVSSDLRAYAAQNIHLDAASHIKLDAGGNNILFENDGTRFGAVQNSSGDLQLSASTGDLVLIGSDNSSAGNDIYLDSSDKIILDADGGSILYKDGGTTKAKLDLADSGYSMHFSASAAGDIAWSSKVSGKIMELDDSAAALMLNSTNKIQFAGTGNYVHQRASNVLEVKAPTVEIDGATAIDLQTDALSIGEGGDTDVVVTFNANTNDGVLTWMEDEDYFKFSDDVLMNSDEKIQFAGTGNYVHQRASNVLEVKAPTVEIDGATKIDLQSDAITLGTGGNTDVALTFAGSTSSGALTWMEDEDEFKFDDDVMIADSKKLLFGNDSDATLGFDPTAGTDGLVLTSAKNVYLTTPSGVEPADFTPTFVISSFHNDDGKQSANNTGGGLVFAKSRSGNLMSDGDHIGGIRFRDGSGTHSFNYAQVYGIATDASGEEGSLAIECRVNEANVEVARFGYKSGSERYGLYLNNNADHGTIKAHSFITYSDETLKDNITPIDSGLEKVMALQGVSYDWKSDGTADIGFIAQEVEKVVPQAVYGKSDGEYGLDYGSLTSVLVEAVKEQQAQIEDLKAELKNKADK